MVCWNGVVNGTDGSYQPGGQPGQEQWAITNGRSRTDWDELLTEVLQTMAEVEDFK